MSLVEIIISLSIASILIALGIPAFVKWTQDTAIRSQAEQLQAAILTTRSHAVSRNERVRLEFTENSGLASWRIGCVRVSANCPNIIESKSFDKNNQNNRSIKNQTKKEITEFNLNHSKPNNQ